MISILKVGKKNVFKLKVYILKNVNIALFGALSDGKFKSKVEPLINIDEVSNVYLFRHKGNPIDDGFSKKVIHKTKKFKSKYLYYIQSFFSLLFLSLNGKVNYLIAFYFLPFGIIVGMVGILTGRPYILILPGSDLRWIIKNRMFLFLLKNSFKIGLRGNNSLNKLKEIGIPKEKMFVLHNSFELPKISKEVKLKKEWDIVFIGYFRKLKRLDVSVHVIKKIKKEFPLVKSVFVGEGKQFESIRRLISENDLENNILLAGHKEDVTSYLKKSKIFLLTSESEGLPMVLIEAMSFGLPVVTSDINDISDIVIEKKNGYLIKTLNCNDYVNAIIDLLKDEKKYNDFSVNAKKSMEEFHNNFSSFMSVQKVWSEIILE